MNRLLGISVMRRLVGGVNGSRYGFSLAAGVVKLTAVALDEVSSSRWPAGGSSGRRMMNTAGGGARDYEKGSGNDVDVGAICLENKDIRKINDSWESFEVDLINKPNQNRSVKQLTTIFERWCAHYNKRYASEAVKKRKFTAFKQMMLLVDGANLEKEGPKLKLTANADLPFKDFQTAMNKNKKLQFGATFFRPPPGGGARDYEKVQEEVDKTGMDDVGAIWAEKKEIATNGKDDVGAVWEENKETTTDSWELFQENLKNFPKWRSEEEIRTIFKRWCAHYEKDYEDDEVGEDRERAFGVFKVKVRLTDEYNAKTDSDKMDLDCFCDTSSYCIVRELDAEKDPSVIIW